MIVLKVTIIEIISPKKFFLPGMENFSPALSEINYVGSKERERRRRKGL